MSGSETVEGFVEVAGVSGASSGAAGDAGDSCVAMLLVESESTGTALKPS